MQRHVQKHFQRGACIGIFCVRVLFGEVAFFALLTFVSYCKLLDSVIIWIHIQLVRMHCMESWHWMIGQCVLTTPKSKTRSVDDFGIGRVGR